MLGAKASEKSADIGGATCAKGFGETEKHTAHLVGEDDCGVPWPKSRWLKVDVTKLARDTLKAF